MLWTIPVNKEEIIIDTPAKAKVLRSLFFVDKNGGSFCFGKTPDSLTIIVDSKVIANELFTLPFITESANGTIYDWTKCALRLNQPVANSEIKISGLRCNDLNVVFQFDIEDNNLETKNEICENFVFRLYEQTEQTASYNKLKPITVENGKTAHFRTENITPQRVFIYPYYTDTAGVVRLLPADILDEISLSFIADNKIISDGFCTRLLSVTERLAWRDVDYTFDAEATKNLAVRFDYPSFAGLQIDGNIVQNIDLAIHLISA